MIFWVLLICGFTQFQNAIVTICSKFKCADFTQYNIKCEFVGNNIDCLRKINKNEVQLGYVTAYEAIPATKLLPDIEILGVVRNSANSSQWKYEIVVVTNKPIAKFEELKDFAYCNYEIGSYVRPKYILDGLERAILKRYATPKCRSKDTFDEEQVCNLNEFFGPSCRSGEWIYKTGGNTRESDYPKLCQLCPDNDCYKHYQLDKCLQSKRGAVVVTTLFNAKTMWNSSLYYLCQNGSTSTQPCVWHNQSWPVIFTHKSLRKSLAPKLNEILSICAIHGVTTCSYSLGEILTDASKPYVSVLKEDETEGLLPTLQPYDLNANQTRTPIRWCTVSGLEFEKCNWLKVFSGTLIYPIECVLRDSKAMCIRAIEIFRSADMMEIVRMPTSFALKPIAISTKPYSLYTEIPFEYQTMCREIYYIENSVLKLTSNIHPDCFGSRFRTVCNKRSNGVCNYHSEVIMRRDDPNRENAKVLLDDLLVIFNEVSAELPFDFFGRFNGVPNLLLQYVTTDFYYIKSNEKVEDVYSDTDSFKSQTRTSTKSIPKWTRSRIIPSTPSTEEESESFFRSWKFYLLLIFLLIILIIYCKDSGGGGGGGGGGFSFSVDFDDD